MFGTASQPQIIDGGMMQSDTNKRKPNNSGSKLLTNAENQKMFEILGSQRVSLSAAVVELLKASEGKWHHVEVGVISMVKDYDRKLYTLLMFNTHTGDQLYEQVLYKNFAAKSYPNCPKFLSFESGDCVYGLYFSDEAEALDFKHHLDMRRKAEQSLNSQTLTKPVSNLSTLKSQYNQPSHEQNFQSAKFANLSSTTHVSMKQSLPTATVSKKKAKDGKKKKLQITKEDIGYPTDFKHKCRLIWDKDVGFKQQMNTSDLLNKNVIDLLKAAEQNPASISPEDLVWVKEFVKKYEQTPTPQTTHPQSTLNGNGAQQQIDDKFPMTPISNQPQVTEISPQGQYSCSVDLSSILPPPPTRDPSMNMAEQQVAARPTPMKRTLPTVPSTSSEDFVWAEVFVKQHVKIPIPPAVSSMSPHYSEAGSSKFAEFE